MKKIVSILIVLLLMIQISSLVLADEAEDDQEEQDLEDEILDDDETDEEDNIEDEIEKEIEIMNYSLGAEIRLLQLKKALFKNILIGEMAVEVLIGLDINTTTLEEILAQMKILLEEINETDPASNDSVKIFVEFKLQAINYTKQFRDTIRELVDDDIMSQIRQRIREMESTELKNYGKTIRNRIRQFNVNQLYRLYGIIGETNNSFINEYINGSFTLGQAKLHISKIINQNTKEDRYEIFSQIKEENIKNKINAKSSVENMFGNGRGKGHGRPK